MEKIGRDPSCVSITDARQSVVTSLQPSREVLEIERLKAKREERRIQRQLAANSVTKLSASEKKEAYCKTAIEKFRSKFVADRELPLKQISLPPILPKILVCVRKRPLLQKELNGCFDTVTCVSDKYPNATIHLHEPKVTLTLCNDITTHSFAFDHVFDEHAANNDIYNQVMHSLIESFLQNGSRVSFFAFGSTGSGKTHTIFGNPSTDGLLNLVLAHVFQSDFRDSGLRLTSSFIEIYGGKVFDLNFKRNPVRLLEDLEGNIQLNGHKEVEVDSSDDLMALVAESLQERTIGETEANQESSRSHAIFTMTLWNSDGSIFSKFSLVDLAGSERGIDTGPLQDKKSRLEGSEINKSLLALKECIRILHLKRTRPDIQGLRIPFRDSKLTSLLRESFIGKHSQTAMMCCIAPGSNSVEQTLNTLRYGDRVKEFSPEQTISPELQPKLTKKVSLPKIFTEELTSESNELAEEPNEQSSNSAAIDDQNFDLEMLMQHHIQCMIQTTILLKEERLIIAKSNTQQYLVDSINLIDKKLNLWTDLKTKLQHAKFNKSA